MQNAYAQFGPCHVILTGMEATIQPDHIALLTQAGHYAEVNSNLIVDPNTLLHVGIDPLRTSFATSFQPIAWDFEIDRFLDQVMRYEDCGFKIIRSSIVGHPVFVPHLERWIDKLQQAGLHTLIHPFDGTFQGLSYPESYTEEEKKVVLPHMSEGRKLYVFNSDRAMQIYDRCAAGWWHFHIMPDGMVLRCAPSCYEPKLNTPAYTMTARNFFRDRVILNEGPLPCPIIAKCSCEAHLALHIPRGASIDQE